MPGNKNSGKHPTPPATKGLKGAGKGDKEEGFQEDARTEPLMPPPVKMSDLQKWVWETQIQTAWWLQQRDVLQAWAYVCLSADLIEKEFQCPAPKIEAWRKLAAVLTLTTAEQQRAGIIGKTAEDVGAGDEPTDFFNRAAS